MERTINSFTNASIIPSMNAGIPTICNFDNDVAALTTTSTAPVRTAGCPPCAPTYKVTGNAVMVVCNGMVKGTRFFRTGENFSQEGMSYEGLLKAFPECSEGQHCFAVFAVRDGSISREDTVKVIKACMDLQREAIITGDLRVARPMIQEDIERMTGVDNSCVSRMLRGAMIYTAFGNYSLDREHGTVDTPCLFNVGLKTTDGTMVSSVGVRKIICSEIEGEDKRRPYTDEALSLRLGEFGYKIARRTVAKYRESILGIPNSRERKCVAA